jgi:hypothetical protein
MAEEISIQLTVMQFEPEENDEFPSTYLHRCGEYVEGKYGYRYSLMGGEGVRQLQITIVDEQEGKRQLVFSAPTVLVEVAGDVMTLEAFTSRYGNG